MLKKKPEFKENFAVSGKCEAFYTTGKIQFTKNGQSLLSICDGNLRCFQVDDGKVTDAVERFEGEEVISFLLAEDDETLVTASKNGFMRQWNLSTKILQKGWKSGHIGSVNCMAFDSSTTLLVTGGSDSTVKVWDIVRKYITHNLKGGKGVYSKVCLQNTGSDYFVFGAADDYEIHVWSLSNSKHITALQGHYSTVTDMVFLKENTQMMSCGRDKVVNLWDITSLKLLKTIPVFETIESCFPIPKELAVPDVTLNSNDTYFITAGEKGVLRMWSTLSGQCVFKQAESSIALSEDSNYQGSLIIQAFYVPSLQAIAVVTYEHNIILYRSEDFTIKDQFVGYIDDVLNIRYAGPKDDRIVVATNSSQIKIFRLPSFSFQVLKGHNNIVLSVDVFPKHKEILVSGSKDNNIKVWYIDSDAAVVNSVYTGYGHTDSVTAICCCRGKSKFFASGSEDTTLKLWEIPETKPLVAVKLLISAYQTVKAHDKLINAIDISENDKFIASASQDRTTKIWDSTELSLLGTLRGHKRGVWCVKFSPVDLAVVTSSGDGTIRIWSLVDFSKLKGHEASVLQVIFATQGTQLISSAADGNICLWDIKTNMCIKTLAEHKNKVWTLTSSKSEEYLASGGADSTIIIWKDVTESERLAKLAEQEEYILQEQELSNLVHDKKWTKALGLAISLDKPFQAYNIMDEILHKHNENVLENVLKTMREDQREALMKFSIEWVTNSKRYYPAILVMNFLYRNYDGDAVLKITNMQKYIQEALPYLDRHFKRIQKRCQDMQILTFLTAQMATT
ncbi:transducin beta-like protein 3 [Trichonephila inaurata madagascariensis]|uniref:Transducin beta-like protein 3 n=1 Tax=Trichonephila inaurata madagascariensis TaxID=2747483 RepID=A0A8X6IE86_9ARAC|nr:transducin beta-like protein 3 [Trichonephila inaurata madagascariensis]